MGKHYLDSLFSPEAIAVFGASEKPGSVAGKVFQNLRQAGFGGPLYPINPKHDSVFGEPCYPDLEALGHPVDMVVIATPAATVPEILRSAGEKGVSVAIVMTAGFGETGSQGRRLQRELLEYAHYYGVRLLGPNCLGLMRPSAGINATFSNSSADTGNLALVSQSGALCTAILDWARPHHVGFSAMVSLGDAADVDFGDLLDFLALDPETFSILLYVEGVHNARRFMSGLRIAAIRSC